MVLAPILATVIPQLVDAFVKKVKDNAPDQVKEALESFLQSEEKKAELQKELVNVILQYNDQMVKELEIREKYKTTGLGSYVRPILTMFVAGVFNITLLLGLLFGKVSFQEYIATLAPINSMLLGFWFGERSALKDPRQSLKDD